MYYHTCMCVCILLQGFRRGHLLCRTLPCFCTTLFPFSPFLVSCASPLSRPSSFTAPFLRRPSFTAPHLRRAPFAVPPVFPVTVPVSPLPRPVPLSLSYCVCCLPRLVAIFACPLRIFIVPVSLPVKLRLILKLWRPLSNVIPSPSLCSLPPAHHVPYSPLYSPLAVLVTEFVPPCVVTSSVAVSTKCIGAFQMAHYIR